MRGRRGGVGIGWRVRGGMGVGGAERRPVMAVLGAHPAARFVIAVRGFAATTSQNERERGRRCKHAHESNLHQTPSRAPR
jgi:hypothetical protein